MLAFEKLTFVFKNEQEKIEDRRLKEEIEMNNENEL